MSKNNELKCVFYEANNFKPIHHVHKSDDFSICTKCMHNVYLKSNSDATEIYPSAFLQNCQYHGCLYCY